MPASVTALGSWPGTDFEATVRMVLGELPERPILPELPDRGVGADMIGRTAAIVDGLGFDLQPAGWRLTEGSGADHRRAKALWRRDLDELEEQAQGFEGPLRVAFAGPWTLSALIEKPRGDKVLADHGARREVAGALAEGIADTLAEIRRRLPGVRPELQLDEPLIPAVMAARVATASGFGKHRRVDPPEISAALETVLAAVGGRGISDAILHCCAPGLDCKLIADAGFTALALDQRLLTSRDWDTLGTLIERGTGLVLGTAPTHEPDRELRPDRLAEMALSVLRPLELGPALTERLTLSPACGLAGWTLHPAVRLIRSLREAANIVTEELAR